MVKMWEGAIIILFFLALIPAVQAGIMGGADTVECPTDSLTYWATNPDNTSTNFTTFVRNSVNGVWTDPTAFTVDASPGWAKFYAKFNWSEIPVGIFSNPDVCVERCYGMSCIDECMHLKIINPPRINVNVSADDANTLQETNFTIVLENPTAGNITANTTAKITLNGNDVQTFDIGSTDLSPHSTQELVQNWTPDKAGPYKIEPTVTFYSADYNNSEQFSNSSEITVNLGAPTTSQILNIEDLPDTRSKDFTVTVKNPTGFNFTTNLTAKAIYNSNTNWSDTQSVQIDPLSEKNVTFTWKPDFMGPFDIKSEDDYSSTSKTIDVGKPDVDLSFSIEYGLIHDGLEGFFVNAYVKNPTGFKFTVTNAEFQLYLDDNGSRNGVSDNYFSDLSMGAFETKGDSVVIPYYEYSDRADVDVGQSTSGSVDSQGTTLQNSDANSILQGNNAIVDAQLVPKGVLKAEFKAYGKTLIKNIGSDPYVLQGNGIVAPDKNNRLLEKQNVKESAPMPENGIPNLNPGTAIIVVNNNSTVQKPLVLDMPAKNLALATRSQ
jgi:hypothetical protein